MKKLMYLCMVLAVFTSCQKEKNLIKENAPLYLWKEMAINKLDSDLTGFFDECSEYAQSILNDYEATHNKKLANDKQVARMLGMYSLEEYYSSVSMLSVATGGTSYSDPYSGNVKKFTSQFEQMQSSLVDAAAEAFVLMKNNIEISDVANGVFAMRDYSVDVIMDSLVGKPTALCEIDDSYVREIADIIVENACYKVELPEISSMQYDKETTYWTVNFYGTDAIIKAAVRKNKDVDGQPVIDYKIIGM